MFRFTMPRVRVYIGVCALARATRNGPGARDGATDRPNTFGVGCGPTSRPCTELAGQVFPRKLTRGTVHPAVERIRVAGQVTDYRQGDIDKAGQAQDSIAAMPSIFGVFGGP